MTHAARIACLAAVTLAGCRHAGIQAPAIATDDPAFARPERPKLSGIAADAAEPYEVLPGDVLSVRTISVAPMELGEITVDAEGLLHVPLAGAVTVGHLSPEDAALRIEEKLHRYDLHAHVLLTVRDSQGHRATVAGAVASPGTYTLTAGMRIADLLQKSGGPLRAVSEGESVDLCDLAAGRVIRAGKALPVDLSLALEGDPAHNVLAKPGDLVVVPASRGQRISVLGEVHNPKAIPFRSGMRLTDSLAVAGGSTREADDSDVRVVRGSLASPRIYYASLNAIIRGEATDVQLEPGDVVFVTEQWFASATDVLARLTPLLYGAAVARGYGPGSHP